MLEAVTGPLAIEGDVVATLGDTQTGLTPAPVVHQMWEAQLVRAYNEVLGGELQPEVELLQRVEAKWAEEPGSEREVGLVVGPWGMGRMHCSLVAGQQYRGGRG